MHLRVLFFLLKAFIFLPPVFPRSLLTQPELAYIFKENINFYPFHGCFFIICSICDDRISYLHLTVELIACRGGHEEVDNGQVPVDWSDNKGVASPDAACHENCDLLICGDFLSRLLHVTNVRKSDCPLERRGPEENYGHGVKD